MNIRRIWPLGLLLMTTLANAATEPTRERPDGEGPWVVRAYFENKAQLDAVAQHNQPWEVHHDQQFAVLEIADRAEYGDLLDAGFRVAIDADRTAFLLNPLGNLRTIPGFACYRTVVESVASLNDIVATYPTLAAIVDIGDSWNKINHPGTGHDLLVLKLTNQAIGGTKPRLFVMAAVHAREYATAETALRFAEDLLARYADDADARWMLDHHELHLLVQANPDGRELAETGSLWRKNVNENYCGATSSSRGADINRNFSFEWGAHGGSSGDPCSGTFRGAGPGSEPETDALITYLRTLFPAARPPDLTTPAPADTSGAFLDIHSYGGLVMWPWGFTTGGAPNGEAMATLGRRMAWFNGYRPQQAVELYVTDGGTKDFSYGDLGIPGMSFEIGNAFFQPCATFETTELQHNFDSIEYLLRTIRRPYMEPSGPSNTHLLTAPVEAGEPIQLVGVADDEAFHQGNGTEGTQTIDGVDVYLDSLPWLAASTPVASAVAADGNFDSSREAWRATLPSTGLTEGRHTLYLRASDSAAEGPVYARDVEVVAPGSTARISGSIRNARSGAPLDVAAQVRLGAQLGTLSDPGAGAEYTVRASSGSYPLQVEAPGYAPTQIQVTLSAPSAQTQDVELQPLCTLFSDDGGDGLVNFTAQAPWGLDNSRFTSAPVAFADSPAGNYAANANVSLTLLPQDFSGAADLRLQFQSYCDTEFGFDYGHVEVSTDGSTWTELWRCEGNASWQPVDIALTALAGQATARLRFRLSSDGGVQRSGWNVDDIRIVGTGATCDAQAEAIFADNFED
ncbi:MAG: M14 family zinc carboxypeptidase [Lysobacterales bacterium]